jgi:tektin-4
LVDEVHQLSQSIDALMRQLNDAEHGLKNLQDQRMAIEKDISIKKNSLFIDREKAMPHRTRYPTVAKLQGYQ